MEANLPLPNIGEVWGKDFFQIKIKDILETKSKESGITKHLIIGISANTLCYFEPESFVKVFKLIKSNEENTFKDFEMDQIKMQLNRLYNTPNK